MNLIVKIMLLVFILSNCGTVPKGDFCKIERKFSYSDAAVDAMSDAEVEQNLAHNLKGKKLCGWKEGQ